MSTTTALDIINGALRVLQVGASDIVLTASEANSGLDALNLMIDSWSLENLMLPHVVSETFNITTGVNAYTFGIGGTFNSARPIQVDQASVSVGGVDMPVKLISFDDWGMIRLKTLSGGYPQYLYVDMNYPLATVNIWPASSVNTTVTLYSQKPLTLFANLTSPFSLPPGYSRALKFGLAIELAPEYQESAGAETIAIFHTAKANLKRINNRPQTLQVDASLLSGGRRFNIYSGQ